MQRENSLQKEKSRKDILDLASIWGKKETVILKLNTQHRDTTP